MTDRISTDKQFRLADGLFCLNEKSTLRLQKMSGQKRHFLRAHGEESVIEVIRIVPYGCDQAYLASVKTGVLFRESDLRCMSSSQLVLGEETDEPIRAFPEMFVRTALSITDTSVEAKAKKTKRVPNPAAVKIKEPKPEKEAKARKSAPVKKIDPRKFQAGSSHQGAVLGESLVRRLRTVNKAGEYMETLLEFERDTGISRKTASDARRGRTWKHIEQLLEAA